MNYGSGGFGFKNNDSGGGSPAPPFDPTSADNGLSVDPGTGRIVLGNDIGDTTAMLLSPREIPLGGQKIIFTTNTNEQIGIDGSNGSFPSMYNILDRNIQATGYFSRNINAGTNAGVFDSVFNNIGSNVTYGVMSNNYAVSSSYAPDMPFVQANNTALNASLSFLSQNGFFWAPHGNNNIAQSAMQMFQNGNLVLDAIGNQPFIDAGRMLQVRGVTELGANQGSQTLRVRANDSNILFVDQSGAQTVGSIGREPSGGVAVTGFISNVILDPAIGFNTVLNKGSLMFAGTTGNTLRWGAATTAPGLTATPVFTSYYGGNTNALGDPTGWALVNINGTDRKVPFY